MREINIDKIIITKRKEQNITQQQLADYVGVSKASVSKWETGQSYPDIALLPKIAAYFNITIDELMAYSPQLSNKEISKIYTRLTKDFSEKPFSEVYNECEDLIKTYYSCFPMVFQMAVLLLNHYNLADGVENQQKIVDEIISLCIRVKENSTDSQLAMFATVMQSQCLLFKGDSQQVIDLLEYSSKPMNPANSATSMVANAYLLLGNKDKSTQIMQCEYYQNILNIMQSAAFLITVYADNPRKSEQICDRTFRLAELFDLSNLHMNSYLILCLTAAQNYTFHGNFEKALDYLKKFAHTCTSVEYPLTLHGDDFFDLPEKSFEEIEFCMALPRDEKAVKKSMLTAISENPAFEPLKDMPRFKSIIDQLTANLGGN